jgi:ornithine cyclodeaminase
LFDSVGFALEDFAALRFMRNLAHTQGLGTWVSLVPALTDPKDLFSLIRPNSLGD